MAYDLWLLGTSVPIGSSDRTTMALSSQRLLQPFRKLCKAMRTSSKRPSPARVHDLRVQTGRVEAVVHAFMPYLKRDGERLIESLKPVRKKAATVRDLDVLSNIVSNLGIEGEQRCVARLHEHLSAERTMRACKLHEAIDERRSRVCRCLKVVSASLEKYISVSSRPHRDARRVQADVVALRLFSELVAWPRLRAEKLHAFRQR
jgi:CHAD domain-containing protein